MQLSAAADPVSAPTSTAEGRAPDSATMLATVLDTVDVGIVACDAAGRLTVFNQATRAWHGLDADHDLDPVQWAGKFSLFAEDGVSLLSEKQVPLLRALRDGVVRDAVMIIRALGQPDRLVRCDGARLVDPAGQVTGAVVAMTDITQTARATGALQQALDRAERIVATAADAYISIDARGCVVDWNPAAEVTFGWTAAEVVGRELAELIVPPDRRAAHRGGLARLAAGGDPHILGQPVDLLAQDNRGRLVPVELTIWATEEDGHARYHAFVRDQSERSRSARDLEQAHEDLRTALNAMPRSITLATVVRDAHAEPVDLVVQWVNQQVLTTLGCPLAEVAGRSMSEVFPAVMQAYGDRYLAVAKTGEALHLPVESFTGQAISGAFDITVTPWSTDGLLIDAIDVTAQRATLRALETQRRELTEAQRLGQLGSFTRDMRDGSFAFSEQIYRIWGLPPGADLAAVRASMIHPDDLDRIQAQSAAALRRGGQSEVQYRIIRPDGELRHLRVMVEVAHDEHGQVTGLHGTHLDITDLTEAQRAAQEAHRFFDAVLAASPDYTFVIDVATGALTYGPDDRDVLGVSTAQLADLGPERTSTMTHPEDLPHLRAALAGAAKLADGQVLQVRARGRHADGSWRWLSRRFTPFRRDAAGAVVEVLGVLRDITDVVQAEEKLTHAALHDSLTGLPNRALLVERLEAALARGARLGHEVAVLFCDLDGFKQVNDTAGHAAGDAVLIATAQRLRRAVRDEDTVARVGGDEFVVVLEAGRADPAGRHAGDRDSTAATPDAKAANQDPVILVASRIRHALRQPITVHDQQHIVSVSIGITRAPVRKLSPDEVLRDADAAMYRAKAAGKDRFAL
ncbi:MAG TPA: diguanylate cyclase [Mycobacteriales bacterium]|nr:diguanylate cyclase [Mycobacteriales bacterium]